MTAAGRDLDPQLIRSFDASFRAEPSYRLMQGAARQTTLKDIALDGRTLASIQHSVSNRLDDWAVTDQKVSGRCWLFAGLNLLRVGAAGKLGIKDFEFSQSYLFFWDKLERANYFLEAMIELSERDVDDRTVACLLAAPIDDGGQWNMFVALVGKHGLVPKELMPETESSSNTRVMNDILRKALRLAALELRALAPAGRDAQRAHRAGVLEVVYRILSIHLGSPPREFLWQWIDQDSVFHRDGPLTPVEFAAAYVTLPLDEYVCLVHDPRPSSPVGRTFTVEYLGNVVDAPPVVYLNVEMDLLKKLAMDAIVGGEPVWFGCDVDQQWNAGLGYWDTKLYDHDTVYGTSFAMSKADRLRFHESLMTHAMLFTGVDVVDGAPRRWRVENSRGDGVGDAGFCTMTDAWFGEHVFEIAVRRSALPPELAAALGQPPIALPPWDPMGALAGQGM